METPARAALTPTLPGPSWHGEALPPHTPAFGPTGASGDSRLFVIRELFVRYQIKCQKSAKPESETALVARRHRRDLNRREEAAHPEQVADPRLHEEHVLVPHDPHLAHQHAELLEPAAQRARRASCASAC